MKNRKPIFILSGLIALGTFAVLRTHAADKMKEAFQKNVFPNDFGPTAINVSHYPKKMQGYYRLFLSKCSKCHTVARPINAQFLQLTPHGQALVKKKRILRCSRIRLFGKSNRKYGTTMSTK